ncbi:MAG TPA: TetR/AcrR family transcriptional regulator [Myxococcales bacterium]|nr:TetR/AcrR family transcriptional regulator [Myxococcales bacterium]HIL79997.1 TetR/AcrR family transcriptional regulator [Myxococcales bacterium]
MSRVPAGSITNTGKEGTRRLPRGERRQSILDGATHAFARAGFAATSMPEIAEASGITPIIVYRHFESKEVLYRATLDCVCSRLTTQLEAGKEPGGFGIGAGSVLAAARHDPDGFRLLWRHAAREPLFSTYAAGLREWAVSTAQNSMDDRVPAEALQWAAHAVVGYLVEAVLNWLEFGDERRDVLFVKATNTAMRAGVKVWSETG